MTITQTQELVLPTQIPFEDLKGKDLEECVFWLLDAMGARDLEWRTGGRGGGAADGGRDLEATFFTPSPDGELEPQRWWIECKGRKGTVDPDEVKSAVNNATSQGDLTQLVIVTNTTFSNPTRDWVKSWQVRHPRPRVKLWDQESLQRLLSRHPKVTLRLFSEALSPAGLLAVTSQRFWDKLEYAPIRPLKKFWEAGASLELEAPALFALIANELAHGSIVERPWAARASIEEVEGALGYATQNLPYLLLRSDALGVDQEPILAAFSCLVLVLLDHVDIPSMAEQLVACLRDRNDAPVPDDVIEMLLMPAIDRLNAELRDVCSSDCNRVSLIGRQTLARVDDPIRVYWDRLKPAGRPQDQDSERYMVFTSLREPCKVGFHVGDEGTCPLFDVESKLVNLTELLETMRRVAVFRSEEAATNEERLRQEATERVAKKLARPPRQSPT